MRQIVVIKKFRDKYTGEEYRPGRLLTVTEERAEEILSTLPSGFVVSVNNGEDEQEKTAEEAVNQPQDTEQTAEDKKQTANKPKTSRKKGGKSDAE
ncbi:MAG: hypothetical protein IJB67_01790 [Firmicutes bacterium]|nr:hypothetical protein [Bacillota bacterium]